MIIALLTDEKKNMIAERRILFFCSTKFHYLGTDF